MNRNVSYKNMKLGKHGLPTWDALIPSVLHYLGDGKEVQFKRILFDVSNSLNLPSDLRNMTSSKYSDNVIENRVGWCISDLFISGALERPSRGVYKISESGLELLKLKDDELTKEKIHSSKSYIDHQKELVNRGKRSGDKYSSGSLSDKLALQVDNYNNEVASKLLKSIQESEPAFFESLVVKLLIKMGYRGQNGTARVTQLTNDGGIDGIINQDPLGIKTVYIQAKRYKDSNVVQRPEINGFVGALSDMHTNSGVFITTSHFSKGAIERAKNSSIVLIDGIQLTNLMLQYHVGVQVKKHLDLFEIDDDFFGD